MSPQAKCLGIIVNPVAGMGGRVGLKGSDGAETLRRARELGATPSAPERAREALDALAGAGVDPELLSYPGEMGEEAARQAGFRPRVLGRIDPGRTTAEDTCRAAADMLAAGADLLLFAGGDGTARDVYRAVGRRLPVVGIPAGVKIHSGVYAVHPTAAGHLAALFLEGRVKHCREQEVMDIDEEAFRQGRVAARLYGYLRVPHERRMTQGAKAASIGDGHERAAMASIAEEVVRRMQADRFYVIGSGTTPQAILERLGLDSTLLGVDLVLDGRLAGKDLNEQGLLAALGQRPATIIVTPIGGQGYLFGRGNQQISPRVIRRAGLENILVVSTQSKLRSLNRRPLRVDTGDRSLDRGLQGYIRVVTGLREERVYRVA